MGWKYYVFWIVVGVIAEGLVIYFAIANDRRENKTPRSG